MENELIKLCKTGLFNPTNFNYCCYQNGKVLCFTYLNNSI